MKPRPTLARRLLLRVFLPVLVVIFAITELQESVQIEREVERFERDLAAASEAAVDALGHELELFKNLLWGVVVQDELRAELRARRDGGLPDQTTKPSPLERNALELARAFPTLSGLELFDPEGQPIVRVYHQELASEPVDAQRERWWTAAKQGRWHLTGVHDAHVRLVTRVALGEELGEVVAAVLVDPDVLVASAFDVLFHHDSLVHAEVRTAQDQLLYTLVGARGGELLTTTATGAYGLVRLDVSLARRVVEDRVEAQIHAYQLQELLIACALLLLAWWGLRSCVVQPLRGIMAAVEAFGQGEPLPPRGNYKCELASLDAVLREAMACARLAQEDLVVANEELEGRVAARTAELEVMRDEALAASRAKSDFLANMSHEIRTPMNGVVGMTDLLAETRLDDEQLQFVRTIQSSGQALLGVINDILDFSKIEAGHMDVEAVDFALHDALHDVLDLLRDTANQKGLELLCDIDCAVPSFVVGDPVRVRQVITNLVGNAIKFTPAGSVTIEVRSTGAPDADELRVEFAVSDTGIGIEAEKLGLIFESFSQADTSTTRRFGGTGLGLTISRRLVNLMGGELRVASEVGQGSTFTFGLRLGRSEEVPADDRFEILRGLDVLLVDDNPTNLRVLERQVLRVGARPTTVADPRSVRELVESRAHEGRPFDVALLDFQMPYMSGVELAKALGDVARRTGLMMFLLSSAPVEEGAVGIVRRFTKPVRPQVLYTGLAACLREGRVDAVAAPLPAAGPRDRPEAEAAPRSEGRDVCVLLVEDNRVNQLVATKLLRSLGCEVVVAEDGQAGAERALEGAFDVVLMDCQMPVLDGFGATERIKAQRPDQLIIAMTANAMREDRDRCLAAGMDDYLSKPVRREELRAMLERHLGVGSVG